jgi:SAM-dependent methyltransferase/tetratricopeptide (TPR) repeat protein
MNRKERRAALKHDKRLTVPAPASAPPREIDELAAEARRHFDLRDFAPVQKLCEDILSRAPSHVDSLIMLGLMAQESSHHAKAVRFFKKTITADPYNAASHYNIGSSYQVLDRRDKAAAHFREAIALGLSTIHAGQLVMEGAAVAACFDRIKAAWPRRPSVAELFGAPGIAAIANDVFLCCALETTRLTGLEMEVFLTEVRWALLQIATGAAPAFGGIEPPILNFCSALAQQYFINEYVYAQSDEEVRQAAALQDLLQEKLRAGSNIPRFLLAIIAAYSPLHALPNSELLLQIEWPNVLAGLVRQQLLEPFEEARDRNTIPTLTDIADKSAPVRRQYEENPYPRWTMIRKHAFPPGGDSKASDAAGGGVGPQEILVAGCGTGRHAVISALRYPNAKVLAVDISLASLAYARRKTREANLRTIEYAQADIMNLGSIGRRFDQIEAIGVLHHLDDTMAGWRTLLSLLRPGGVMRVGLYSATARQGLNLARAFVSERGYRATADDIRACRQELIRRETGMLRKELTTGRDFYAMSECRDLLFHVMEHQFTIADIKAFVTEQGLSFLGFDADTPNLGKFQQQFPGTDALVDLDRWERFEAANPQTFGTMYLFDVQSPG